MIDDESRFPSGLEGLESLGEIGVSPRRVARFSPGRSSRIGRLKRARCVFSSRGLTVGFSLLLFLTGCALPGAHLRAISDPKRSLGDRAAEALSRAIQIKTVNPPGDEKPLAEYFAAVLSRAGIEAQVVDTPTGDSTVGRAAVWGIVRGSGVHRPIVLLSHLDVVPADAAKWEADPFAGSRSDGYVVGRGALDAKGVSVIHLLTMIELARRETPLERDVIFLATPDEETGGLDGAGFIARQRPDLLHHAEYLLTEGGGILIRGEGQPSLWRIGVVEKNPCWLRVVARGTPGHSSVPPLDAAPPRLIAALQRVSRIETPIQVVPEVARMYAALSSLAAPEDASGYSDLARHLADDPHFRSRFMTLRWQAALVRNTITTTVLEAGSHTNVVPAEAAAHLDIRLLPGQSCEATTHRVRDAIDDPGITVEPLLSFPSRSSPIDNALFAAIETVSARSNPPGHTVPSVTIGFTDAHYFRDIGVTAYGFTPRALRRADGDGIHGINERAKIEPLADTVTTLLKILDELDRSD